jgi:hypothetical protein
MQFPLAICQSGTLFGGMAHTLPGGIEPRRHVVDDLQLQRRLRLGCQYSRWRLRSQNMQAGFSQLRWSKVGGKFTRRRILPYPRLVSSS